MGAKAWSLAILFSLVCSGCTNVVTFVVQAYPGPTRSAEKVSIVRINTGSEIQVLSLDGDALGKQTLAEDSRLHIELLPGKHEMSVQNTGVSVNAVKKVRFVAEAGRIYRVLIVDREWHTSKAPKTAAAQVWSPLVYEVDGANDHLLREVSLPPRG